MSVEVVNPLGPQARGVGGESECAMELGSSATQDALVGCDEHSTGGSGKRRREAGMYLTSADVFSADSLFPVRVRLACLLCCLFVWLPSLGSPWVSGC